MWLGVKSLDKPNEVQTTIRILLSTYIIEIIT